MPPRSHVLLITNNLCQSHPKNLVVQSSSLLDFLWSNEDLVVVGNNLPIRLRDFGVRPVQLRTSLDQAEERCDPPGQAPNRC